MNEEEKRVIERIEDTFYSDLGKGINKFQKITLYEDSIRDVRVLLNLIEKLQKENEEIEEKDKIIQNMSKYILSLDIDKDICMKNTANTELCNEDNSNCVECIRKHFSN